MTDAETATRYRRYIACLNERRLDLAEFVHEELTYNGKTLTRRDYERLIAGDVVAIPDLFFDIQVLVVADDWVACRLHFACAPVGEFLGLPVNGQPVSFADHVFYRLREGKILEVVSLIDRTAIEKQLASG